MKRLGPDKRTRKLEERSRRKMEERAYERVLERAITDRVAQETEDALLDDEPNKLRDWSGINCRCTLVTTKEDEQRAAETERELLRDHAPLPPGVVSVRVEGPLVAGDFVSCDSYGRMRRCSPDERTVGVALEAPDRDGSVVVMITT